VWWWRKFKIKRVSFGEFRCDFKSVGKLMSRHCKADLIFKKVFLKENIRQENRRMVGASPGLALSTFSRIS